MLVKGLFGKRYVVEGFLIAIVILVVCITSGCNNANKSKGVAGPSIVGISTADTTKIDIDKNENNSIVIDVEIKEVDVTEDYQ